MSENAIYVGQTPLVNARKNVEGGYQNINGESFYKIHNYDVMKPFFMSIVSDSNHWMFISSNGGLTAGRQNADHSLFPYYTDDKVTDGASQTGSRSVFLVERQGKKVLWEPFTDRFKGAYAIQRNLYKHDTGNQVIFEEVNHDLKLTFRYAWKYSEAFGFVKESTLINDGQDCSIDLLDGIQNLLPSAVGSDIQTKSSTLVDAYKKNELDKESQLGMFMLSAVIVDKPVPSEALKATTVWYAGLDQVTVLLSSDQVDGFCLGKPLVQEEDIRARRGAYFVNTTMTLASGAQQQWILVADVDQGPSEVAWLRTFLKRPTQEKWTDVQRDISSGTDHLLRLIGMSDGIQLSQDRLTANRHLSNVLFNIMRGGLFEDQYQVETDDFKAFLKGANRALFEERTDFIETLPVQINYMDLQEAAQAEQDPHLNRLVSEYLPLTFSRRHGDPSRPWNQFSIDTVKEDGGKNRSYQGNWRDIFQNWEALAIAFPEYLSSMIAKFVNASTIDGYNPYRITREGIDWEKIEPDDPWSFIGYWGDHQIIYLLKLLEASHNHHPGLLEDLLSQDEFCYANVPYRIKSYEQIVANPRDTIDFDDAADHLAETRFREIGSDGKLVWNKKGKVLQVNLAEKLLVTLLTKLSNFIPGAGIWLNTQRPEWNDANNALVGNGVSMVTVYYLRRFVAFLKPIFKSLDSDVVVSKEVIELLKAIKNTFVVHYIAHENGMNDQTRRQFVDSLGKAGEVYRNRAYAGLSEKRLAIPGESIFDFLEMALAYIDDTIKRNKRTDNLYHAYNLVKFTEDGVSIDYLYEMLEGQVGVLSAGLLKPSEVVGVMNALKASKIYREDQYSYMLYPDRQLPRFLEKNNIPDDFVQQSNLLQSLAQDENLVLINKDLNGEFHFNGSFNNAADVEKALEQLKNDPRFSELVKAEGQSVLEIFEKMFNHYAFTGRSGTFYGYEGLGSIYWHMVSKLVLAIGENFYLAHRDGSDPDAISQLIEYYYETRAGIGLNKSPELYGAFPTDPYSHTPGNKGAQQPGMTGQVKEDVLSRWLELGVHVADGIVRFDPALLREEEFLHRAASLKYYDLEGELQAYEVPLGGLAFTYCQVPIAYVKGGQKKMAVDFQDGQQEILHSNELTAELSQELFRRTGKVKSIMVSGF